MDDSEREGKLLSQFHAEEHPLELQFHYDDDGAMDLLFRYEDEGEEEEDDLEDNSNEKGNSSSAAPDDNGVDEESEEDDQVAEEGENIYRFRFHEGMDPLVFTQQDAFGHQPYKQFERLEHDYEALAAKKRQARALGDISVKKRRVEEDNVGATMEEIMEAMNYGSRRKRRRKSKRRGRRKGSRNKDDPELQRKVGDALMLHMNGDSEKALRLLYEVIRLAPNLPDPYHRLGLIYKEMGDKQRSFNFYTIAAHLSPKEATLWKLLVAWSTELDDLGQARYFLRKAIAADPEDINIRFHLASLHYESGEYLKAAAALEQISQLSPEDTVLLLKVAGLYIDLGQRERAISIMEHNMKTNSMSVDLRVVKFLASLYMKENLHEKALELIEHAQQVYGSETPLNLIVTAGICHVHLGDLERAEAVFSAMSMQNAHEISNLIFDVGDSLKSRGHYDLALKYYMTLKDFDDKEGGYSHLKIAECYRLMGMQLKSIEHFYKALDIVGIDADARVTLASLLLEVGREDDAISVLSPPKEIESSLVLASDREKQWWLHGNVKFKLSQIYEAKGMLEAYVDVIFPVIREKLRNEIFQQNVKVRKKRLTRKVLSERIKILGEDRSDSLFPSRPVASTHDRSKALRAKKVLEKREAKKAAALAAGTEWFSDQDSDGDDESHQQELQEPPLLDLPDDIEHHGLVLDLCKKLSSLQRFLEALELIRLSLKLAPNVLSVEKKEELRTLGAQIAYKIADPAHGWEHARHIVNQRPYSFAAWDCYYRLICRRDVHKRNKKFLLHMKARHKDMVPAILISGHLFTMISQHQAAARDYLEAYKLMPESPLINLCVGTALINLALGFRLPNKHQCVAQGLAFLLNNLRICDNSQEALYNIARAYHQVGLVSLATTYYEKVLAMREKDYPIPRPANENLDVVDITKPGYCDLRREAAYNLHLIYKKSGALNLARQVLRDHCSL